VKRRWGIAVMLAGLWVACTTAQNARADAPCREADLCAVPVVHEQGYRYFYEGNDLVVAPVLRGPAGPAMEYMLLPACAVNHAPSGDGSVPAQDAQCSVAFAAPQCAPGQILMRVYTRRAGTTTAWRVTGTRCVGPTRRIPVAALQAGVREQLDARLVPPEFAVQPPGRALVNLPVIVHVTSEGRRIRQSDCAHPEGVCFDVTVPVPGRLEAYPTYSWIFDSSGTAAQGRGRAYDGTSPRQHPEHYVAHTYARPTDRQRVSLTVTWKAAFTIAGLPPLDLADLPKTAQAAFSVVEARSQLVAG
jgi:hypothetical protein